jgi:AcrR family transcriptional regulator
VSASVSAGASKPETLKPDTRSPDTLKEVIRDFRRDQVIDVARRLFGERGTTEVSMDEIATEAGVARSTVYVYFANRDELLRACLKRMHTQLLEALATVWGSDTDPGERLRTLIEAMFERLDDNPAFFRLALVTQEGMGNDGRAVGNELALISLDVARLIQDLYLEGVTMGRFCALDPDRATSLIGQQIYGAMSVRASDPAPWPRAEAAAEVSEFLLRALAA